MTHVDMHQFVEGHPEFAGFSAYYDANILPALAREEQSRLAEMTKVKMVVPVIAVLTVLILAAAYFADTPVPVLLMLAVIGVVFGFAISNHMLQDVQSNTKKFIVGGICSFLGCGYTENFDEPSGFQSFVGLGLIAPNFTRATFQDGISGKAHGADFGFYEAHLQREEDTGKNKRWVTTFRGQVLSLKFDRMFLGHTVVLRDKGMFNKKKRGEMKRVGFVDPVFEKIFEAYGTDQVEARYLLTPTFMQRLVDLEKSVDGKNIRFGFTGGFLLVVIETGNRYEAGSMFKPLIETARTQTVLNDIGAIYSVIDGVVERPARR